MKSALVLFSGGKDSCMALLWAKERGYKCSGLIATDGETAHLSDGPEIPNALTQSIAQEVFNIETQLIRTDDTTFKEDLAAKIEQLLDTRRIDLIITGDLDHKDGIIHFLRERFSGKKTKFLSIGEIYSVDNIFDSERYMEDTLKTLDLVVSGIRLPDFNGHEDILGKKLDANLAAQIDKLKIDRTGEDGEYQSVCLGAKKSRKRIRIDIGDTATFAGRDTNEYSYKILRIASYSVCKIGIIANFKRLLVSVKPNIAPHKF